jgi:hypothetical protein
VGFRPQGPVVRTGQWSRPLVVTQLPGNGTFVTANLLFMAWLRCDPQQCSVERLWPEGKASEYEAVATLLPELQAAVTRAANRAVRLKLVFTAHSCAPPNYETKVDSPWQYTEAVSFSCPIRGSNGERPRESLEVYATGTIIRDAAWKMSGTSVHTTAVRLR